MSDLKNIILNGVSYDLNNSEGLTDETKQALLQLASKVAYIDDDGQDYYQDLYDALYPQNVTSISCVYTQSGTVYDDDSLDSLKSDLVVTAQFSDGTTHAVTTYSLSGTLEEGTSTVTVSYLQKTTTFNVTVTSPLYSIPDFAEQTITVDSNKYCKVSKTNGYYTIKGTGSGVVYISPNGIASTTKPMTDWFSTPANKPLRHQIFDLTWANPGASSTTFAAKFSRPTDEGNLAGVEVTMSANSTGHEDFAELSIDDYPERVYSGYVLQLLTNGGRNYEETATFRMRLFCDGVRYL